MNPVTDAQTDSFDVLVPVELSIWSTLGADGLMARGQAAAGRPSGGRPGRDLVSVQFTFGPSDDDLGLPLVLDIGPVRVAHRHHDSDLDLALVAVLIAQFSAGRVCLVSMPLQEVGWQSHKEERRRQASDRLFRRWQQLRLRPVHAFTYEAGNLLLRAADYAIPEALRLSVVHLALSGPASVPS